MRIFLVTAFLAVGFVDTALSRSWESQNVSNDIFLSRYNFGSGRFTISCGYQRYFELVLAGRGLNGPVTFSFDDGTSQILNFNRSGFSAGSIRGTRQSPGLNKSQDEKRFYKLITIFRRSNFVTITADGLTTGAIPLGDLKATLNKCRNEYADEAPAPGTDVNAPLNREEVIELQSNLTALGFYDGPVDGRQSTLGIALVRYSSGVIGNRHAQPREVLLHVRQNLKTRNQLQALRSEICPDCERVYANITWKVNVDQTGRRVIDGLPKSGGRITVICRRVEVNNHKRWFELWVGPVYSKGLDGSMQIRVDDGPVYTFESYRFVASTDQDRETFRRVLEELAQGNQAVVRSSTGQQVNIPLTGSALALGEC